MVIPPAPAAPAVGAHAGVPARRVVLDLVVSRLGEPLHGTALVAGSPQGQAFWGVLELMRILEFAAEPAVAGAAPAAATGPVAAPPRQSRGAP